MSRNKGTSHHLTVIPKLTYTEFHTEKCLLTSRLTCSESLDVEVRLMVRPWGKVARLVEGWLVVEEAAAPVVVVEVVEVVLEVNVG